MSKRYVRITHKPTGEVLAEGPLGWNITPFEGNYYVRQKYVRSTNLKLTPIPGFCVYKFLYLWMDLHTASGRKSSMLAWKYVLPNPLFPFIWFRIGLPKYHPEIEVEEYLSSPVAPLVATE